MRIFALHILLLAWGCGAVGIDASATGSNGLGCIRGVRQWPWLLGGESMCVESVGVGMPHGPSARPRVTLRLRGGGKEKKEGGDELKKKRKKMEDVSELPKEGKVSKKSRTGKRMKDADEGDEAKSKVQAENDRSVESKPMVEKRSSRSKDKAKAVLGSDESKTKKRGRSLSPGRSNKTEKKGSSTAAENKDGKEKADTNLVSDFRISPETALALEKKGITSLFPIQVCVSPTEKLNDTPPHEHRLLPLSLSIYICI